jgi:NitT/TauT family transport system substrate-binding protein
MIHRLLASVLFCAIGLMAGCSKESEKKSETAGSGAESVTIGLNWVPEPEFGGIYAADQIGAFKERGLTVEIRPGGAGSPIWQQVAAGKLQFGISSADEILIGREQGADIVGIYAIYQTNPQGIMVHASRGLKEIGNVFKSGILAREPGLAYAKFLEKKFGGGNARLVPYTGGIANFLNDKEFAQQCFVFSEPVAAKRQGADVQVFLVADAGYNPYTGVVITSGEYLKEHPETVKKMAEALRLGWRAYLDDPRPANEIMGPLNTSMDAETFALAAEAQESLVENDDTKAAGLGTMTAARWTELGRQLIDIGMLQKSPVAGECFVNP